MRKDSVIVAVEDDQLDAKTLKRAFKEAAIQTPLIILPTGEDALAYLNDSANQKPALILLDLNTPRMRGLEFLRIIKADARLRTIPVIILTTSSQDIDKQESFELSVAGYMVKTMDYENFVDMIKTIYKYWATSELPNE